MTLGDLNDLRGRARALAVIVADRTIRPPRPEAVLLAFRSGKDTATIAQLFGCHESDVYNAMKAAKEAP